MPIFCSPALCENLERVELLSRSGDGPEVGQAYAILMPADFGRDNMDIKSARIMVIEDERVMSAFIMSTLRRIGILDIFAYEDGAAALREVTILKPDLILTDIHMQPVGGIEFVSQLRALSNNQISNIPVIFLSADASEATVSEVLPLGVSGYIVKPPSLEALAHKIEVALRNRTRWLFGTETDRPS